MENRVIDRIGFDNWMLETVQSIHYLNNDKMDKAHQRLLNTDEPVGLDLHPVSGKIKEIENVNTTPKRKIFRSFRNPFKKQKVSN